MNWQVKLIAMKRESINIQIDLMTFYYSEAVIIVSLGKYLFSKYERCTIWIQIYDNSIAKVLKEITVSMYLGSCAM